MPNMYTRGILFGKMVVELGDTCTVKNGRHGLSCDLEFKTKVSLFRVFAFAPDTLVRASFLARTTRSLDASATRAVTLAKSRGDGVTSWNSRVAQFVRLHLSHVFPNGTDVPTFLRRPLFFHSMVTNASCLTSSRTGRASHPSTSYQRTNKNRTNLDGMSCPSLVRSPREPTLTHPPVDCGTNSRRPSKPRTWKRRHVQRRPSRTLNVTSAVDVTKRERFLCLDILNSETGGGALS